MDLWVMAAAAAAGYLAKYWQHTAREEGLSDSASSRPVQTLGRGAIGERMVPASEMASTSGYDEEKKKQENEIDFEGNFEMGDRFEAGMVDDFGIGEMGNLRIGSRSRNCIRSRKHFGCSVAKPLSAIESCLVAQLYKEHVEMEEYVFSSLPSPSTSAAVRPLLVTDGKRIISRSSSKLRSLSSKGGESKLRKEDGFSSDENECVLREESVSMQLPKKQKQKRAKRRHQQHGRLGDSNAMFSGSPDGMLLFCLGLTIGVVSSVITNKREVEKLNDLLKQTKNFVQDLQEELEMKDSLTVRELANEGYDSQETNDHSFHNQAPNLFSSPQELDKISSCDAKRPVNQTSEANSESMSKIEAELEAELERLELNMNASSLDGKLSGLLELDPDFMVDMVHGELRADKLNRVMTDSDRDASGASTNQQQNANYAVSPMELSLRLHEVIRSRLEEQINELENALQNSQRRVNLMESNQTNSWRDYYSSSERGNSSRESPSVTEANNAMAVPLLLNLSGDALDAYNEAYEEFDKPISKNEENPPCIADENKRFNIEKLDSLHHSVIWDQNGGKQNRSLPHLKIHEECDSSTLVHNKIRSWRERISSNRETDEFLRNEDENEEDDSEEMAQLLKQVLEKSRQGSPLVLNAQRLLFSMD